MGSAGSTLQRRESLRRRRLRSRHTQGSNPRLAVEARERPLEVQEALFDWRLLPKRKRKWMEKEYAWEKSSPNIEINSENPTVFLRHPVAQRTDLARGKLVMEHGLHLWKFTWPAGQRGTHALIGKIRSLFLLSPFAICTVVVSLYLWLGACAMWLCACMPACAHVECTGVTLVCGSRTCCFVAS